MLRLILAMPLISVSFVAGAPALAQAAPAPASVPGLPDRLAGFADVAELALASPVIVRATITRAERLRGPATKGVLPGRIRMVVTAAISNVLVAPGAMGSSLQYLWDAPLNARGRAPAAKGMDMLVFVTPPGLDGATRLVSRRGQQPYDPALADQVRAIVTAARTDTVPTVRGVTNGFRANGTIPGESESQFFLETANAKPATLIVQNRPGEARRIMVAQGDIIDESARRVVPDTLLWYRLTCFLPQTLPADAGGDDAVLAKDWADAMASLGACGKTG